MSPLPVASLGSYIPVVYVLGACMLRSVIMITCTGVSTNLTEFYKPLIVLLPDCH